MFRVRFFVPGDKVTVGGGIGDEAVPRERQQTKIQLALNRLLKKQGMIAVGADDAGFTQYQAADPAFKRATRRPRCCPNCGAAI